MLFNRIHNALAPGAAPVQTPSEVLQAMNLFAARLARGRQEDAHELLRMTQEALQHACLRSVGLPTHGPQAAPGARPRTLVERIFGGVLRSSVLCRACGKISIKDDPCEDLSLEIQGGIASLDAALAAFTRTERLDKDNLFRCDACKQLSAAEKRITVAQAPNVLVVHLKRFSAFGSKISRPVAFAERLSLSGHMADDSEPAPTFTLFAVVVHAGFSVSSGHYYAYVRAAGGWHLMDDSFVRQVSLATVLASDAYMLFYQRLPSAAVVPQAPASRVHIGPAPAPTRELAPLASALLSAARPLASAPMASALATPGPPGLLSTPVASRSPTRPQPACAGVDPPASPALPVAAAPLCSPAPSAVWSPIRSPTATPVAAPPLPPDAVPVARPQSGPLAKSRREALQDERMRHEAQMQLDEVPVDSGVAHTAQLIRDSSWRAEVTARLRALKRRSGAATTVEALLHEFCQAGDSKRARATLPQHSPDACQFALRHAQQLLGDFKPPGEH